MTMRFGGKARVLLALAVFASFAAPTGSLGQDEARRFNPKRFESLIRNAPAIVAPTTAAAPAEPGAEAQRSLAAPQAGTMLSVKLSKAQDAQISKELEQTVASVSNVTNVVALPGVGRQQASDGGEVQLKPLVLVAERLHRNDQGAFVASIQLGVAEIGEAATSRGLTTPVVFQVLGQKAEPSTVRIGRTGPPYEKVDITSREITEGAAIQVMSSLKAGEMTALVIPVEPALDLGVSNRRIDGLGLGTAELQISADGIKNPEGRTVRLKSDPTAYLSVSSVPLNANGEASVEVRSAGIGPVVFTASVRGLPPATANVQFGLPVLTLAAAALGGLAGGGIRVLSAARARTSGRKVASALALALLVGVIVFGLYAIGVNVFMLKSTVSVGATFVFVVAALGGFFGTRVLERFMPV
jgi:hypothetical protein